LPRVGIPVTARQSKEHDDQRALAKFRIDIAQVRFEIDRANQLLFDENSLKYAEPVVLEQGPHLIDLKDRRDLAARRSFSGQIALVASEDSSIG
jgi:hypothetical protein